MPVAPSFFTSEVGLVRFPATGIAPTNAGNLTSPTSDVKNDGATGNLCYYDTATKSVICGSSSAQTNGKESIVVGDGAKAGNSTIAIGSSTGHAGVKGSISIGNNITIRTNMTGTVAVGNSVFAGVRLLVPV